MTFKKFFFFFFLNKGEVKKKSGHTLAPQDGHPLRASSTSHNLNPHSPAGTLSS